MNIILLFSELVICYFSIFMLYKKYRQEGLRIWLLIAMLLSNIMITKSILISNVDINLGIITEATIFIVANIIIQKEGKDKIFEILKLLIWASIFSYGLFLIVGLTNISNIAVQTDKAFNRLFFYNIIIYLVNNISLFISLLLNSTIYYSIKRMANKIWLSNFLSTILSQLIYNILFGFIYLSMNNTIFNVIIIVIIRYLLTLFTILLGTIFIYYIYKEGNYENKKTRINK